MSFIKRLDEISGTETRSKNLSEAIAKVEEAVKAKNTKPAAKSNKSKGDEKEEA